MHLDVAIDIGRYLNAGIIIAIVLMLIIKRRYLVAAVAAFFALLAHLLLEFQWLDIGELAVALIVGGAALAYEGRWRLLAIFAPLPLLPPVFFAWLYLGVIDLNVWLPGLPFHPLGLVSIVTMCAPALIGLASVFCVGAFIERRAHRAEVTA